MRSAVVLREKDSTILVILENDFIKHIEILKAQDKFPKIGISWKNVSVVLEDERILTKELSVPKISSHEIEQMLKVNLSEDLQTDIKNVLYDYYVFYSKEQNLKVLVEYIRKDQISSIKKELEELGIFSLNILSAFVVQLNASWEILKAFPKSIIFYLSYNRSYAFLKYKEEIIYKEFSFSLKSLYQKLQTPLSTSSGIRTLNESQVKEMLFEKDIFSNKGDTEEYFHKLYFLIRPEMEKMGREIKQYITYCNMHYSLNIEEIILTGKAVLMGSFSEVLGHYTNKKVIKFSPEKFLQISQELKSNKFLPYISSYVLGTRGRYCKINIIHKEKEKEDLKNKILIFASLILGMAIIISTFMGVGYMGKIKNMEEKCRDIYKENLLYSPFIKYKSQLQNLENALNEIGYYNFDFGYLIKQIANLTPQQIVLSEIRVDAFTQKIILKGKIYAPSRKLKSILKKYITSLLKEEIFTLTEINKFSVKNNEAIFEVSFKVRL